MNHIAHSSDYETLTPDTVINSVESATGYPMTGFTSPLPSYINRVYELQAQDETRLIAKFYRPGRWSREAIEEEHSFVQDCVAAEIPAVPPMTLVNGSTLGSAEGILFAVYPKRLGREFEITDDEGWIRIGRLLARIHNTGATGDASDRVILHPLKSTVNDIKQLMEGGFVPPRFKDEFKEVGDRLIEMSADIFDSCESIRLHGDCHNGNIIHRPGEGIMLIDFDDMLMGPPVQDLWLLLPDHADKCRLEIDLILEGYEMFRQFDYNSLKLIEPLRAMRIIYFLAWCSRQANDFHFRHTFPDWGSDAFWQIEITGLQQQLTIISDTSI